MGLGEVIALALAAAGTGASMAAASNARKDMNSAMKKQLLQQEGFKRQATPIFQQSLAQGGSDRAQDLIGQGEMDARRLYDKIAQMPLTSFTSPLPVDEQRLSGVVQQQRGAAAKQQGYNQWALNQWLKNQQANNQLGVISNLAGASARNAPMLTQLAGQKSQDLAGIGSLLSTAGNLAAVYGATRQPTMGQVAAGAKGTTLPASTMADGLIG